MVEQPAAKCSACYIIIPRAQGTCILIGRRHGSTIRRECTCLLNSENMVISKGV